jgi:hypothetical protein
MGRVIGPAIVPVRLVASGARAWRVARRLGIFSAVVAACPRNDQSGGLQDNCFDAEPILQDPTIEALEPT